MVSEVSREGFDGLGEKPSPWLGIYGVSLSYL